MKKLFTLGLTLLMLSTVPPAAAQEKLEPFVFAPQWMTQAQFAGYYVAYEKGFYREEGLDVTIEHPTMTRSALDRVLDKSCDATCLTLLQAMEMIDQGIEMVNILQTSMESALVLVSRRERNPAEHRGARVSTWRVGFGQLAECMSAEKSLNYDWIQAADGLNLFIAGAVDAMLAMSYNEMYQLLQTGLVQSEQSIWRFSENGYNIQEDGVYMIRDQYLKNPERAKRFARASRRGWEWAAQNPEAAYDIVMDYVRRDRIATNPVLQKLMLDEILRLLVARDTGFREYRLRPEMVEEASNILYRNGMLRRPVKMEELLP